MSGIALLEHNEHNFSQFNKITPTATLFIPRKGARIEK
jgi:hypothetical protein